jgi:heme/copper-type cytochrome/quinol oxidase subunit 3
VTMATSVPAVEPEPVAAQQPRNVWVAARLGAGATAFFFLAFVFAYFYLRSIDAKAVWKIGAVHPSSALGIAIVVAVTLSAAVARAGRARVVPAGALALALGLVAVALQCVEYTTVDFGPASGGYASVFFGWTAMYAVAVLLAMYWLEVQVATAARAPRGATVQAELTAGGHEPPRTAAADVELAAATYEATTFYWSFLAGIGILAWVVLYLL